MSHGPGCVRRSRQLARIGDRGGGDSVGVGKAFDVGAVRCAEQGLELIGGERRRLGEEREDATAIVVDDHDPQVG